VKENAWFSSVAAMRRFDVESRRRAKVTPRQSFETHGLYLDSGGCPRLPSGAPGKGSGIALLKKGSDG
jgi:hypothetical protein